MFQRSLTPGLLLWQMFWASLLSGYAEKQLEQLFQQHLMITNKQCIIDCAETFNQQPTQIIYLYSATMNV